jgi:hypothetical protein
MDTIKRRNPESNNASVVMIRVRYEILANLAKISGKDRMMRQNTILSIRNNRL